MEKRHRAPSRTAFNLQGRLKSWNTFDLVLFGLPARFSLCFIFCCSWGPCGQREIHKRSRARSFCPSAERCGDVKWELNRVRSAARSKATRRRCQLFSSIPALLPRAWRCGKVTRGRNWCSRPGFLKPVFFLEPGPAGHPLCSAFAWVRRHRPRGTEASVRRAPGAVLQRQPCPRLPTARGELGAPRSLCQPPAHKSFIPSQQ